MVQIHRSALVNYTPSQMFELVNDVEAYPRHFNWCTQARVLQHEADAIVARLDLRFAGLSHSFTTRNRPRAPDSITIDLVEGPFRSLSGEWGFKALANGGCKVSLELAFDYTGLFGLGNLALKLGFQGLASHMVDDFCREARNTYG